MIDPRERCDHFVVCAPGIEPQLHEEIRALKLAKVERQVGGVRFEGTHLDAQRANLELRTAVRVLRRVARFEAPNESALDAGVASVDWSQFVAPEGRIRIDARSKESTLDHTLFLEQRTKDGIADWFRNRSGVRPSVDLEDPDLGVHVHIFKDRCTLLVDTSGDSLHKRGWRKFQGRAPLAETLAAAMVLASGWDERSPLVDPFCGSGTILIEALAIAADVAPGTFGRKFGFQRWPGYAPAEFDALLKQTRARAKFPGKLVLRGHDIDASTLQGARENIASAGFEGRIDLERGRAELVEYRKGWNALLCSNLPYGERIGDERELMTLFQRFGARLREQCSGYRATFLSGNERLAQALGITPVSRTPWKNGALDCELLRYEI